MDKLSHKCLSLQFLVEFYEAVVEPLDPNMTTKRVADELFKPYTRAKGGGSVMDAVAPAFISYMQMIIRSSFLCFH